MSSINNSQKNPTRLQTGLIMKCNVHSHWTLIVCGVTGLFIQSQMFATQMPCIGAVVGKEIKCKIYAVQWLWHHGSLRLYNSDCVVNGIMDLKRLSDWELFHTDASVGEWVERCDTNGLHDINLYSLKTGVLARDQTVSRSLPNVRLYHKVDSQFYM